MGVSVVLSTSRFTVLYRHERVSSGRQSGVGGVREKLPSSSIFFCGSEKKFAEIQPAATQATQGYENNCDDLLLNQNGTAGPPSSPPRDDGQPL